MSIEKMKFVMASGPSSQLNKVITACCNEGYFHPENAGDYISQSMGYLPISEENPYLQTIASIKELASQLNVSLDNYKKVKGTVIDENSQLYVESILNSIHELTEENKTLNEQIEQCKAGIEKFKHFSGLGVNLEDIFSCKFISTRFGYLSKDGYIKLTRGFSDNPYMLFCQCSNDVNGYWGMYFAPKEREEEIDRIFAALHFERLSIPSAVGTTDEIISNLEEDIKIIENQKIELEEKLNNIWKNEGEKIKAIYAKLLDLNTIYELRKFAVVHEKSCFFVGWIPASKEKALKAKLERYPDFTVEFEKPQSESNIKPPTKLKNLIFFRPYKYYVDMYGTPSYDDIDITSFVAVTYTLLFGIMFGDLGQGVILSLVGLFMWKKMKIALGKILVLCGAASAFFGFIFGSVFGYEEMLDPVYEKLGWSGKPLSVMESINTVLVLAIGIGVALVICAMLLNVISCIKKKKFGSALFSENGVAGICTYIGGASLAYTFMAKKSLMPSSVSVAMLVVGILILYNKEIIAGSIDEGKFKKPESISDYILQNLFECIEYILSYFSNTVSFLRVGAFVIVHASMMMVVFTLAGDPTSVKGIIVVAIGNVVVIALEGLLTGIQGLRLEFYEMFSRFYEGEGKPFEAVKFVKNIVQKKKSKKIKAAKAE